ncbi:MULTISPECIES: DUF262 domain-containing protein [Vibrio]|uniref:DUF262 domain-containing protein n=1 Tax=Vibrio TaxID=662 RepID=UPI00078D9B14|nr:MULTISPECIES: DUF262 domain-containing protein [Vibrio]BAU70893.1 hypothetical protein [Vibrio sp. 04Ya108]BBM67850.1 hypothetical protein VA249_44960 [Vibrio alfacsensis]BCN27020.1 hypothetical protein VYA_42120 [Vibrio alfacsensis]
MNRLPKPIIHFTSGSRPLELLICGGKERRDYPWTSRFIGDWPLPMWQRELCWTQAENVSFLESVYQGYDLGSVMVNNMRWDDKKNISVPMSDIIIDGQQRINALFGFVHNKIPVNGLYWRDLTRIEQRTFREREIGVKVTSCYDEAILKKVYNHLNFSGVRHLEKEKA